MNEEKGQKENEILYARTHIYDSIYYFLCTKFKTQEPLKVVVNGMMLLLTRKEKN